MKEFKQYSEESSDGFLIDLPENDEKQKLVLSQAQILPEEIDVEKRKAQLESFENLQKDIEELHDLFTEFSQQVHVS